MPWYTAVMGRPKGSKNGVYTTVELTCEQCGNAFVVKPSEAQGRRYCSPSCYHPNGLADRFWDKVAIGAADECWEWQGYRDRAGYGHVGIGSRVDGTKRTVPAHRLAWELTHGPIPEGIKVRHLVCDNPPCCNPAHLALGTQAENVADMIAKGRKRAKLTDDEVAKIRQLHATGDYRQAELAEQFGVTHVTIWRIVNGESWKQSVN